MQTSYSNAALALSVLLLSACSGGGGADATAGAKSGQLSVEITDAPFAHDIVSSARIQVDRISVIEASGGESGTLVLYDGDPIAIDLLDLSGGATDLLVRADVPAGTYDQLRLHVSDASLELIDGDLFSTELGNLHLTSTGTSGLKVHVDPPIEVVGGLSHELLLDFDLTKSFHAVPGSDLMNATSYKLMPVIRATNTSMTGEIRGVVRQDDGTGTLVGVEAATVYLMPPGEGDPANAEASTMTQPDGQYALLGVTPGLWDVLAVKDAAQGRVDAADVVAGNVTSVDLEIQ